MNFLCIKKYSWGCHPVLYVFLAVLCLQSVTAQTIKPENVSIQVQKEPVEKVFSQLSEQTGLKFFYEEAVVNNKLAVNLNFSKVPVKTILDEIAKQTKLYFIQDGNTVSVQLRKPGLQNHVSNAAPEGVEGIVLDEQGLPVVGANVIEKGTTNGVITDVDGKFTLTVKKEAVLTISYIGYNTMMIPVAGKKSLNVRLKEDSKSLDEVVVVGYGKQKKGNLTGSIATVKSEEMTVAPVASTINSLAGKLPGLISQQTSGQPGSDQAKLSIRGFGQCIWIVDGIEADFNIVDPNQIESISILKDGSASIYGARAGNGVILVTTKRGQLQKPIITVNSSFTLQGITTMPRPASAGEYATLKREEWLQSGKPESTAPYTEEQIAKFFQGTDPQYPNTDWYSELIRNWSPQNQHNISVRGGSEKIKYYGFLGYLDQESIWKNNGGNYKRYNLQSNIDAAINSQLSLQLDLAVIKEDKRTTNRSQNAGDNTVWADFWNTLPTYPSRLPDPDKISFADGKGTGGAHVTSNTDLSGYFDTENLNFRGTIALKYDVKQVKGLSAKVFANYFDDIRYEKTFTRPSKFYKYDVASDTYIDAGALGTKAQLSQKDNRSTMLTRQVSVNYDNTWGIDHHISALVLYEDIDYSGNWLSASRDDMLTPSIEELFVGSTETMKNNGASSEMGRKSFVARANYSYMNKYLIESTLRADASAKFAPGKRWGLFPSVSLGWRMTEESFMENSKSVVDDLKFRASYGRSGNDDVGNFKYLSGYQLNGYYLIGQQSLTGISTTGLANPYLTWENTEIYNGGFNFSLFNRLVYGEADGFYRKRMGIPETRKLSLPSTFGADLPTENINSLNDRGFEFSVGTSKSLKNFSYDISGNISWSRSKWDHYEESEYTDPDQKRINQKSGQWTDRKFGYVSNGLFISQKEIDELGFNQDNQQNKSLRPGDIRYVDVNGDEVLDWKDQVEIGKGTTPHWMYGFTMNLKYKDFDLSALFQGAFGYYSSISLYHNTLVYPKEVYDLRWNEKTNNVADALVPRLGGSSMNSYDSDYRYKKAGYLRLKSFAVGYNLPAGICRNLYVQQVRVYLSGTNLFTLDKLKKYNTDPEAPSGMSGYYYPQQRTVSLGVNLSF